MYYVNINLQIRESVPLNTVWVLPQIEGTSVMQQICINYL